MEESDWEWLPGHLLDMILDKLVSFSDYVRFGAVCKQWKCVARANKVKFLENKDCKQVPFLMVPSDDNNEERRSLYSITQNKIYDFQLRVPYKKRFSGSSHGWLFAVAESMGVTLMNPFSGATIELPPLDESAIELPPLDESIFIIPPREDHTDEDDFEPFLLDGYPLSDPDDGESNFEFEVVKAILSADPALSPNDYIVAAIYGGCCRLAFIRAGDEDWTYIDKKRFEAILDVTFYRGHIFAVDYSGGVIRIDVNRSIGESSYPQVEVIAPHIKTNPGHRTYFVESSSRDLLLVLRDFALSDDIEHETSKFKVFKLLLEQCEEGWPKWVEAENLGEETIFWEGNRSNSEGWPKWVEVENLGGDTLFLGDNHSICVSASKWPGCQPNSIYYTDDLIDYRHHPRSGRRDIGVFNIENGSFGKHYILHPSHNHMRPSIWIVPTVLENRV